MRLIRYTVGFAVMSCSVFSKSVSFRFQSPNLPWDQATCSDTLSSPPQTPLLGILPSTNTSSLAAMHTSSTWAEQAH